MLASGRCHLTHLAHESLNPSPHIVRRILELRRYLLRRFNDRHLPWSGGWQWLLEDEGAPTNFRLPTRSMRGRGALVWLDLWMSQELNK